MSQTKKINGTVMNTMPCEWIYFSIIFGGGLMGNYLNTYEIAIPFLDIVVI